MSDAKFWYVVKKEDETCSVDFDTEPAKTPKQQRWGPFKNEQEAIAKKIGLIRAGKCKPQ